MLSPLLVISLTESVKVILFLHKYIFLSTMARERE